MRLSCKQQIVGSNPTTGSIFLVTKVDAVLNIPKAIDTVTTQLNQIVAWLETISGQMKRMIKLLEETNERLNQQGNK